MDDEIVDEAQLDSATVKEKEIQAMYKSTVHLISLDASTFTHPVSAYNVLVAQSNYESYAH